MYRVALVCEYDGTNFVGFQTQKNGRSVQQTLEEALTKLFEQDIKITGCSRTDSGVHARGHVSHCDIPFVIPEDKFPLAINSFLPDDLAVKKALYVNNEFSARFDTLGKRYVYRVYTSTIRSPLISRYAYHYPYPLDIEAMNKAGESFVGDHDFGAFCAAGGSQKTTVRKLFSVRVSQSNTCSDLYEIEVQGQAFLYNMVRIIAGTLLYVGCGKLLPQDIPGIIDSSSRKEAGKTLPPQGLTLEDVLYDWQKARTEG